MVIYKRGESMKKFISFLLLILLISLPAYSRGVHYFEQQENEITSKTPYGDNPAAAHYAQSDDAKIYYETYGGGTPVLVLHGGGVGCPMEMGRIIDKLSKHYYVIVPSTRGHGRSEIGRNPITFLQKVDDIMAVVNQVTNKPMIIVGFSDGAYTAFKIASMYPNRVKKIIAIGAGENIPALRKIPLNTLDDFSKTDKRFIEEKIALCPEPKKLQDYLNRFFTFYNKELISQDFFSRVKCPVLMIAGELDSNAPLDTVINAYKMLPNAQLAIIANAHHRVFTDNFDAVWANIAPFIDYR